MEKCWRQTEATETAKMYGPGYSISLIKKNIVGNVLPGTEEKILTAEYALDFAMQAVNRALLVSLEAIEAQRLEEKKEAEE